MPHPSASAWRYGRPREGVPREVSNPEPTVVNELDIGQSPPIFRPGRTGTAPPVTSWQGLLGDVACRSVQATLASSDRPASPNGGES